MKKSEIIDSRLDIRQVLESYGVQFKRNRFACPVHHGKDPNCTIGDNTKVFTCFVCNKSFNILSLVMELENCDWDRAVDIVARRFGIDELTREFTPEEKKEWAKKREQEQIEKERKKRAEEKHAKEQAPIFRKKANDYIKSLNHTEKSWAYLKGRGISAKLCEKYGVRDCRIKCFDEEKKREWFESAIMIPYSRNDDEVWCWRRSIESKEFRKTNSKFLGDEPLFNWTGFNNAIMYNKKIFITESAIDALSAEQLFGCERVEYVSIGGSAIKKILTALGNDKPIKIVGGFDNDEAGEKASMALEEECRKRGIPYQRFEFDKDCKDINDYLKRQLEANNGDIK